MPAQWTGALVGKMHVYHITAKQLSAYLGYHPKYVSQVLNGRKNPRCAEARFTQALDEMIAQHQAQNENNL